MKKILVLFFLASLPAFAQNTENEGKEPHKRTPLSMDELLKKNEPQQYRMLTSKSPYLLVANYRNGKRWRYFEGDQLRFKTREGRYFDEELAFMDDSTFTVYHYDYTARKMEQLTFGVNDIRVIYKHKRGGVWKTGLLSMGPFVPMALLDWGLYRTPPTENRDFLWIAPAVGVGNILIFKHKNLFNKQRIRNNKAIKIIVPYSGPPG